MLSIPNPKKAIYNMFCPFGLQNNPNKNMSTIDYITIHNTDNYNSTATAKGHAQYQFSGSGGSQTSWHYTVDDQEIWQSFENQRMCWHAGNNIGNSTSIGIEICVNKRSEYLQTCVNTAWLVSTLLKTYKLGLDRVVQHNYWSGKNCPENLRSGAWGVKWTDFTAMVNQFILGESGTGKITDIRQAIDKLKNKGIINSPDYWLANYGKLQYLDLLIINMSNSL